MVWHLDPIVYTARHYDHPADHDRWRQFDGVATVQMLGEGRAHISGLHADQMTREMRDELERALRAIGVTELDGWRRRNLITWR